MHRQSLPLCHAFHLFQRLLIDLKHALLLLTATAPPTFSSSLSHVQLLRTHEAPHVLFVYTTS